MSALPSQQLVVAVAGILKDGQILVGRRQAPGMPRIHDKIELPGGVVEFGEDPLATVAREVLEETGLVVSVERMIPFAHVNVWEYPDRRQHTIVLCYVCAALHPEDLVPNADHESTGWHWKPIREIDLASTLSGVDRFLSWITQSCL